MNKILFSVICFAAIINEVQFKSSSIYTTKAISEPKSLDCEKAIYLLIDRTGEIEFNNFGLKRNQKVYVISAKNLNISEDENISQVFFAEFEDDLILIFDKSNDESGSIIICRISFMKPMVKWKIELPSMNPSYGVIENQFLYQAGVGYISKINLNSGKFEWKHGEMRILKRRITLNFLL